MRVRWGPTYIPSKAKADWLSFICSLQEFVKVDDIFLTIEHNCQCYPVCHTVGWLVGLPCLPPVTRLITTCGFIRRRLLFFILFVLF